MAPTRKTAAEAEARGGRPAALAPEIAARVIIEAMAPAVDDGRFPIKRTVGEEVRVTADVFADGHDQLAAVLQYRHTGGSADRGEWQEVSLAPLGNDRWGASFRVRALGRYEYRIAAWVDRFQSWREELTKKVQAGQEVGTELIEGAELVRAAAERARPRDTEVRSKGAHPERRSTAVERATAGREGASVERPAREGAGDERPDAADAEPQRRGAPAEGVGDRAWLLGQAEIMAGPGEMVSRVTVALDRQLAAAMARYPDRTRAVISDRVWPVLVERERARFGSWYEMFPRSVGPDPTRSATFDEASTRLPDIAGMGFDVLYLPPIHPIGRTFRKGRNNTLIAGSTDPGSPWAIGSEEGGHTAVEPGLGTIEDFGRFVATARRLGLEIALDIAFQTSPDHPWVREHPEWFMHRPDGSIKYAENPPKKYQDIYPLNFETGDWRALWEELRDVMLFWLRHGVHIFRVDNPHTKPFRFWRWALDEVRQRHPEVIFLSEAFTRPKVMRYLAKCGFSQSYTYFTWRNTRAELVDYFTELTQTEVREYMRPNLFANTPDILHAYLQQGGRPAFQVRLILAGTLGATYGIYSGFELAENQPARPGSEEYLDSEKYQIKHRDWNQAGNLNELIARLNRIRRENVALQSDWSLRFHATDNDQIIAYSKQSDDPPNIVLMVVNLDPFNMQHGWLQVPLDRWSPGPTGALDLIDLISNDRYQWHDEWNYVRLEPGVRPAHVFAVRPVA